MENEVKGAGARERARQLKGSDDWVEIEVPAWLGVDRSGGVCPGGGAGYDRKLAELRNFGKCA